MKYSIDYFIKKFKAIPDDKWYTGGWFYNKKQTKFCALGHCRDNLGTLPTPESISLSEFLIDIPKINDRKSSKHPQKTPKARILAALNDLKRNKK